MSKNNMWTEWDKNGNVNNIAQMEGMIFIDDE